MKPLFDDTTPEAERVLVEGYRAMSPAQKLQRILSLNRMVRQLATARLRARYGADMPERELRLRLAALHLPRDVMVNVFGWDPEEHGY